MDNQSFEVSPFQKRYAKILKEEFTRRKLVNPDYSLRAFAQRLKISPASLSNVLALKKPLTLKLANKIIDHLKFSKDKKNLFLQLVDEDEKRRKNLTEKKERELAKKLNYREIQKETFSTINEWYFFAILNIVTLASAVHDPEWISERLGLSTQKCKRAIDTLVRCGLLEIRDQKYFRTEQPVEIASISPSEDIRKFHRENIQRALESLSKDHLSRRDISSIMMPVDRTRLEEAKKMIKNFRRELADFLKSGPHLDEIYSLNIQLFPQTEITREQNQ